MNTLRLSLEHVVRLNQLAIISHGNRRLGGFVRFYGQDVVAYFIEDIDRATWYPATYVDEADGSVTLTWSWTKPVT